MKKATPKTAVKKTIKKAPLKTLAQPKVETSMYRLTMKLNDEVFNCETNDLTKAILSFKPVHLKTKVNIVIEKDGKKCERQLFVNKGKLLFRNELFMRTFIRFLIFK